MGVVEYANAVRFGFIRFEVQYPSWTINTGDNGDIRYFDNRQLVFTSTYCPNSKNWYAMGVDQSTSENVLIHFRWDSPVRKAGMWVLIAHNQPHFASIILDNSLSGSTDNLPVRGYYVGSTSLI